MTKQQLVKVSAVVLGLTAAPAFAGAPVKAPKNVVQAASESCISGDLGVDVVSQYIARGISLENQGAIFQPYVDLSFRLWEGNGSKLNLDLGLWNSFHSRKTVNSGATTRNWFESDFTAGLSLTLAENLTISGHYRAYMSPNDAFGTAHTVGLGVSYNDSAALGAFALHPYVYVQREIEGKSGNGNDEGFYFELGITPGTQVGPIALNFPIKLGLGADDYYAGDETFGFFSAGVDASYDLACIPECLGTWTIHGGATFYVLGDATENANVPAVRDGDDTEWVFGGGLRVSF